MDGLYLSQIVKELKRIANALEKSNEMIQDLGGKK